MRYALSVFMVAALLLAGCPQEGAPDGGSWEGSGTCSDSDGGIYEFTKGVATVEGGAGTDKCLGMGESVLEYYCEDGVLASADIECPQGFVCEDGACIVTPCFDTEEDADAAVAGTVQYAGMQYADSCIDEDTVREYSCGEEGVSEEEIECGTDERCGGGECTLVLPCIDTDGGQDVYSAGITSVGAASYEDICVSYNVVFEYYCEDGGMREVQIMCPDGQECSGGVCVEAGERECTDTDNGKSRYKRGTVSYWVGGQEHSETDKCYDQDSVLEVWCTEEGSVGFGILECYDSDWCEDGACTSGS
jgi:hypothetical protein